MIDKKKESTKKIKEKPKVEVDQEIEVEPKVETKEKVKEEIKEEVKKEDYFYLTTLEDSNTLKENFIKMFLPHGPQGICYTSFWHGNIEIQIKLKDGIIFVDPKDRMLIRSMEKQDFIKE